MQYIYSVIKNKNKMTLNVQGLGQVFTRRDIVSEMISLRNNFGTILEPSCGNGSFTSVISDSIGIEIDSSICPNNCLNMDFFDYASSNKFDTIIGNPPYVAWKHISESTRSKLDLTLFDKRSNLFLFFIEKCVKHLNFGGELIFITPREFLKNTSSLLLNDWLLSQGTFTHVVDLGDAKIWDDGSSPNVIYWRFEKDNFSRDVLYNGYNKNILNINGQIIFSNNNYTIPFSDYFFVKVGAVSGADEYFEHDSGKEFVCSRTFKENILRKMIFNIPHSHLYKFKDILISRKIKKFTEKNWWSWGRNYFVSSSDRIYVNSKVRSKTPFFQHPCRAYDGSVLAIFPKYDMDMSKVVPLLNSVDWEELGFYSNGRMFFTQKSLENINLPENLFSYLKEI